MRFTKSELSKRIKQYLIEKDRPPYFKAAVPPKKLWKIKPHEGSHWQEDFFDSSNPPQDPGSYRWSGILGEGKPARKSLYATVVNPRDYLNKTAMGATIAREKERGTHRWDPRYKKIRDDFLSGNPIDPVQWWIWNKNCEILGHEGRHRAAVSASMMSRYPKLRKIPIVAACVSDYLDTGSWRSSKYVYAPWKTCQKCLNDFPINLLKQREGYGRTPRMDSRFGSSGYRPTSRRERRYSASGRTSYLGDCEQCGRALYYPDTSRFCSDCYATCKDCGTRIGNETEFCYWCKKSRANR